MPGDRRRAGCNEEVPMGKPGDAPETLDPIYGVWAESLAELISYRYLGCSSELIDRDHAVGHLRIRSDLRSASGGMLAAPLAIAMLDTAGITVDRRNLLALTHVEVDVFDPGQDVAAVRVVGSVTREARTQVFTEARIEDADDADRVIAFGTADWTVIGPTAEGFEYTDPSPGVEDGPDLGPLSAAYDARPRPGGELVIDGLSPRVGTDVLHHGPILVVLEAAALDTLAGGAGTDRLTIEHAATRIVKGGRVGPFVTSTAALPTRGHSMVCRAELLDEGADNAVVAVTTLRAYAS
jgi:acyl-coenzyme A thioesterase PaaI-like protein